MLPYLIQPHRPRPPKQGLSPLGVVIAVLSLRPASRELDQHRRYDRQNTGNRVNQQIPSNMPQPLDGDCPQLQMSLRS